MLLVRRTLLPLAPLLAPALACAGGGAAASSPEPPVVEARAEAPATPPREFDHAHAAWSRFLARHVRGDAFDYAAAKKTPGDLDAYLESLHAVTPEQLRSWSEDQRFAFWINVYNAHTIKKVVDNYPIKSIKKLSGAFGLNSVFDNRFIDMPLFHPKGKDKQLSLNDVEHEILRKNFEDARLHAAINCASYSCPPLRDEAFVADKLDAQLNEQMRSFVNDPKRNRLDRDAGILRLSEIFKWFSGDFERDAGSVRDYVLRYLDEKDRAFARSAKVSYIDYDWALNDVQARD